MTLQGNTWIVPSCYCNTEDDGNLRALKFKGPDGNLRTPELPCFHVVWSSCIECILVFKQTNKQNPNFVWSEAQRYCFFLGVLSCISLPCSECAHTTPKGRVSSFCLWFKLAGWEPAPIWKQCSFSVQCSARLKLTQLCCVYELYFFPWVCWTAWRSWGISHSAKDDIAMLFGTYVFCFFGKQWIEILG